MLRAGRRGFLRRIRLESITLLFCFSKRESQVKVTKPEEMVTTLEGWREKFAAASDMPNLVADLGRAGKLIAQQAQTIEIIEMREERCSFVGDCGHEYCDWVVADALWELSGATGEICPMCFSELLLKQINVSGPTEPRLQSAPVDLRKTSPRAEADTSAGKCGQVFFAALKR